MKSTESNSSPEPEEIQSMVCYAKNLIEEFRRAKHYKNILFPPTFPLNYSCFVVWFFFFFFPFSPVVLHPFVVSFQLPFPPLQCFILWLCGTPKWAPGDVRAEPGENGKRICRHQRLHAPHDVPGHGRLPVHAGLGWSHELRGEDYSAIQVKPSVIQILLTDTWSATQVDFSFFFLVFTTQLTL